MAEVSAERQFRGSVRLMTLLLWRLGESTDVEDGFSMARELGWLKPEQEQFVRTCFALDKQLEAGEEPSQEITMDMVKELQACTLRINSADPC